MTISKVFPTSFEAEIERLSRAVGAAATYGAEALSPFAARAGEMSINGWDSVEDLSQSAFESGKDAFAAGEKIICDPKTLYEDTRTVLYGWKSKIRDAFDKRNQIIQETRESLANLLQVAVSAARDPGQSLIQLDEAARHILKGSAQSISHSTAHFRVGRKEIAALNLLLANQAAEYRELGVVASNRRVDPSASTHDYLDALLVGGDVLKEAMAMAVPEEILDAYVKQYPRLSDMTDFRNLIHHLSPNQIGGLVSGIKGKLFEIQYAHYLNETELPAEYHADLAHAANQKGWDIEITGPDPQYVHLLQLKATDSVAYVQQALNKYPDINVVTPSELHAQLVLKGLSERVVDSGISHAHLKAEVHDAVNSGAHDFSPFPSVLAIAILAFTSYEHHALVEHENARRFGTRTGSYLVSYWTGAASHMAIPIPFVGFAVAAGVRLLVASGRKKVERLEAMAKLVADNDVFLDRVRGLQSAKNQALTSSFTNCNLR